MRTSRLIPLVLLALVAAGCARPPKPGIDNLYRGLSEDLPRLDPGLLTGRRIVVDAGHGGHFAGTRGADGLEESSVNLGVSLYLWGLLREAGAEAYLTRSAQRDFLAGPDSSTSDDLRVRVAMIDSIQPDIVVSIHHNAQPLRDPSKNAVETYYKLADPASRDLAFAVHRHLARNLGIEEGEVRPGNYYILREVAVPAILGEGSYLSHPGVEGKLRLSEKQRLEAEAYFLGILEYFSRGTPTADVLSPAPGDSLLGEVPVVSYAVTDVGGVGIDPSGIEMTVNGGTVDAGIDPGGRTVSYRLPWDAPNGLYEVSLVVRNILGNSSHLMERAFVVAHPAKRVVFSSFPETVPAEGGIVCFRARLLDRRGLSIADGSRIKIAAWYRRPGGEWNTLAIARGEGAAETAVTDGVAEFSIEVPHGCAAARVAVIPAAGPDIDASPETGFGPLGFEYVLPVTEGPSSCRSFVLLDRLTGTPVVTARFFDASGLVTTDVYEDRFVIGGASAAGEIRIDAAGYRPMVSRPGESDTLHLDPWYGGALAGKRYVLNAEGAPPRALDRGPLGLAGSYVNLHVARFVEEYLSAAGARVRQARRTEETPTDRDVVLLTNRFRAGLYVEVRYRRGSADSALAAQTYYFPGSLRGFAVAGTVGSALGRALGIPVLPPAETVTFPLQQTACPAIIVVPPSLGRVDEELRLSEPWYQRKQAYAIFGGLLADAGVTNTAALHVTLARDSSAVASPSGRSNWLVTVDDTWRLLTSPDGEAVFDWLPAGIHQVVLRRGETTAGPFEIELQSGDSRTLETSIPPPR